MSTDQRGIIHWFNPSLTTFDMTPEMRDHLEALTTARLMSPDDPNYMPVDFVPAPRFDLLDFVIQVLNQLFGTRIRQAIKAIRTYD